MHFEAGHPTVESRASIINSRLELTVLSKDQLHEIVKAIMAVQDYPNFSVETVAGDSLTKTTYMITINEISWASNLLALVNVIKEFDYNC